MVITTSYAEGFESMFQEIKTARPDLNNNSRVAQEAVRRFWEDVRRQRPTKKPQQQSQFEDIKKDLIEFQESFIALVQPHVRDPHVIEVFERRKKALEAQKEKEMAEFGLEHPTLDFLALNASNAVSGCLI